MQGTARADTESAGDVPGLPRVRYAHACLLIVNVILSLQWNLHLHFFSAGGRDLKGRALFLLSFSIAQFVQCNFLNVRILSSLDSP